MDLPETELRSNPDLDSAVLKKVNRHVMPILVLGFIISYIDRANLSVLFHPLSKDLALTASNFGLAAGFFFVGYFFFEIPSNIAMVRFGARRWLARIMGTWGMITIAMAATRGPMSLYILRLLLGVAEAGFYPGVLFYLTLWYPPRALARSYAYLILWIPVAFFLGSTLSSTILAMDGVGGIAGWKWVFILEGLPAILLGVYIFIKMPDSPGAASWLSESEKRSLALSISPDRPKKHENYRQLPSVLKNPLVWVFSFMYFVMLISVWGTTYFMPKIVSERFAIGSIQAGYLAALPWLCAVFSVWLIGRLSVRVGMRRWYMLISFVGAGIGLVVTGISSSAVVSLIGLCVAVAGMQAMMPLFWIMPPTVFRGAVAAVAIAAINSIGNASGLAGPWLVGRLTDMTGDSRGALLVLGGCCVVAGVSAFFLATYLSRRQNREIRTELQKAGV